MKIYTKKGDQGLTHLADGEKVCKNSIRINAYGTLDELNSFLGLLIGELKASENFAHEILFCENTQAHLFELGSQLSCENLEFSKNLPVITDHHINNIETQIDQLNDELPELKNFVLPGGHRASSYAHICRTICRRSERIVVELNQEQSINYPAIAYLNRLSDYFFMLARAINHRLNIHTPLWVSR